MFGYVVMAFYQFDNAFLCIRMVTIIFHPHSRIFFTSKRILLPLTPQSSATKISATVKWKRLLMGAFLTVV